MSEIEKMYENAGIEKCNNCLKEIMPGICLKHNEDESYKCEDCEYNWYPDFTADKQIELIKWLAKTRPIHITFLIDKWIIEGMVRYGKRYDTFVDALSGYINNIWQDLTESEQEQIKDIVKTNCMYI